MAPARWGAICGLLAAASFGASAPLAKWLGTVASPLVVAGLLYAGAGVALSGLAAVLRVVGRPAAAGEAALSRGDVPTLVAITVLGGMLGPLLMLYGLARTSATAGALTLNLEAPFTALVAVVAFGEHLGRRAVVAALLVMAGAALLAAGIPAAGPVGARPLSSGATATAALAAACLAWALDNNLTQRISGASPIAVVRVKTLGAAAGSLALAVARGDRLPAPTVVAAALAIGAVSYGASVLLDVYALRLLGAAREAAFFATAPFVGAVAGACLFSEPLTVRAGAAGLLMAIGVVVLLRERHAHVHTHAPLAHEHRHVHDEHHRHDHGPELGVVREPHSHWHRHDPITHLHPHTSDSHHRHRH